MASTLDYIQFVCEQINGPWVVRYKKMFGEYMVYTNDKPVLLVCDNVVYVKMIEELKSILKNAEVGVPYKGARPHYILDIENNELTNSVISILEPISKVPTKKIRTKKQTDKK